MKKVFDLAFIVAFILAASGNRLANSNLSSISSNKNQVDIRIIDGGWGDAKANYIQAILNSAADELLKYFPDRRLNPIMVEHNEDGPRTLYRRGPDGETIVWLDVEDSYWAQFAYQFSHEFTHILAGYENVKVDQNPNQWFEESLCVTASIFTLRQMAITWGTSPPYSWLKSYAPSLRKYADDVMNKQGSRLPPNMTLAEWYKENEANLRSEDVDSPEARNKQF
jgi:hypothetical protein